MTRRAESVQDSPIQELGRISVVFLNYLLTFQTSCSIESIRLGYVGNCRVYDQCLSEMNGYLSSLRSNESPAESLDVLEKILRKVKAVFEPEPSKSCFSAEMLLNELDMKSRKLEGLSRDIKVVVLLMSHLCSGECIDVGESVADFLDDIFLHYGDGCERVMTQSGFTKLWNDLQMQRKGKHIDHGVQKNTCFSDVTAIPEKQASVHTTYKWKGISKTDTTNSNVASTSISFFENENQSILPVTSGQPIDTDSSPVVLISPTKNSKNMSVEIVHPQNSDVYLLEDNDTTKIVNSRRAVRHMPFPNDHEHKNLANECLPSDDLLQRFLTPGNEIITSSEFLQLCPALVQQAVSGVCTARLKAAVLGNKTVDVFQEETFQSTSPWLAVLSVSIITAISLLGLFLLPVLKKSFFVHINSFFTGLAFGTMSGDVVLHLMPQYLKLHQHDSHGHDHDAESPLEYLFPSYLQRQLTFLLTMYLLFLVECIFSAMTGEKKEHHGHSHGPIEISLNDLTSSGDVENGEMKPKPPYCSRIIQFLKPSNLFSEISSKAAVIVLADTVHNFADGMAIAVGFSMSYKDGFSTSVAVFFHELPHEIGDFAILMNCGLSYWKAFVFNILSGLSAFLGLAVGVFTASLFREWLLCITAGLFFFVVMGEMLPDMRLESKEKWREFAVKIIGTILGIITMICIAIYELSAS